MRPLLGRSLPFLLVLLLVGTPSAGLAAAGPSNATRRPDYTYAPELGWWIHQALEWASEYTGSQTKRIPLPTYVRCYTTDTAFEAELRREGDSAESAHLVLAYYLPGTGYINVRATTCRNAWLFTGKGRAKKPVITQITAGAMAGLLHEALHRQGLDDERLTECYADTSTKYAGWNAWWQYVPKADDAAWAAAEQWGNWAMKLAFRYTQRVVATDYHMTKAVCLKVVSRISWADRVS